MASETKATPKASTFSIKGPYLSAGRVNIDLARTNLLWLRLKVHAEGGEPVVHSHPIEDHAFIVLEVEATFFDEEGNETKLRRYEGVMLPKGAFYRYLNTGGSNLFLLRVGAKVRPRAAGQETRRMPDGTPIAGDATEDHALDGVPIPGRFFGAP